MMRRRLHNDETGQALVEYLLTVGVLARAIVSSIRNGISSINNLTTHELVLGTCVFVALAFVTSRLFGHHR
jgi:Flp pilus assembly pilin Flp